MFPGPVFFHELRSVARRRRSFVLRALIGLFLLYLLIANESNWAFHAYRAGYEREYSPGEMARIGAGLFGSMVWLQALVILFLTPALLAGAIAEDRQRRVLSYLLASPLRGDEIVLGKLAARLVNLVVLVSLGLPVVSLALFLGGVAPDEVWLSYGASLSTLYVLAGISIFVSTFSAKPRDAIVRAYLIELGWLFLPGVEELLLEIGGPLSGLVRDARPVTEWVIGSSPALLLSQNSFSSASTLVHDVSWMIGLQLFYGTCLLAWSTIRLRAVEQGARLWGFRWLDAQQRSLPRRLFRRRSCGDHPMIWKECSGTLTSPSRARTGLLAIMSLAALGGLGYWVYELGIPAFREVLDFGYGSSGTISAREAFSGSVRILTAILYVLAGLLLGTAAATGVTMERERDTWTSLTSTPLEGSEILEGKILGAFWRVRTLLWALLVVWLIGLICGAVHPLGFLAAIGSLTVYLTFVAILGTYFSLWSRSSARSISWTIAILVFINGGYLFCCIPLIQGPGSILFTAGMTPMFVTAAPFSFSDLDEFSTGRGMFHYQDATLWIITAMVSLAFHGAAAFALYHACLNQFEIDVDRPRRFLGTYPQPVSAAGIVFVDEDCPGSDGVRFVENAGDVEGTGKSDEAYETPGLS